MSMNYLYLYVDSDSDEEFVPVYFPHSKNRQDRSKELINRLSALQHECEKNKTSRKNSQC